MLTVALFATAAMTGVIWVVQLVHYPIFGRIDRGEADIEWVRFAEVHRRSISLVVGPLMAAEGVTGIWLVVDPPADVAPLLPLFAAAAMAVAYGVTAFVSVPLHARLTHRWDPVAHRRLVATNWIRTAAWTLRAVLVAAILLAAA